ncbi:unnamed protein product [Aphanomyces euteiches]|uniref:J domain-containing protein n=1 Tax=Aphanomyces euteiches TaxID=100861 RepID=A0A6G0WR55_9STRA|nr:hypothetical protein Ae201684_012514 [Aphanomyces euteiches]KAH9140716.1 hypothetical protein AeRB84_015075 [Aphanomyces euteiches]
MARRFVLVAAIVLVLLDLGVDAYQSDPYATLGIPRGSSEEQIKRAYKKLAVKYHPDKNTHGNQEAAKEKFVRVQEAYEILTKKQQTHESQYQGYNQQRSNYHQQQYHHHYGHHQQQQHYYYYSYSSPPPPPRNSSPFSIIYLFFFLGILAMYIYNKFVDEQPPRSRSEAPRPSSPPTPKKEEVKVSQSPFASLAASYAPQVPELSPALLQTKRKRVVIMCIRKSPDYCSHLEQWMHIDKAAEEFKKDPLVFTWCDVDNGMQQSKWESFFDAHLIQASQCALLVVSNQTKYVALIPPSSKLSYGELQEWLSRLVGGEISPKELQSAVPL